MMRTALALSPHLDDAVFSCGGTLHRLARTGWRVVVATMFTQSVENPQGFALTCQLDKGLAADVDYMALRRREDEIALSILACGAPRHLPLREAPHRGYGSARDLFGPLSAADDVAPHLVVAIQALIAEERPALILAPQAIGGHVDHVQTVEAVRNAGIYGASVLWWRDFPYIVRSADPPEPFRDHFADLPTSAVEFDAPDEAVKMKACAAYQSQIGFHFGGAAGLRAKLDVAGSTELFCGHVAFNV